mgnify:CR=1 FL=1
MRRAQGPAAHDGQDLGRERAEGGVGARALAKRERDEYLRLCLDVDYVAPEILDFVSHAAAGNPRQISITALWLARRGWAWRRSSELPASWHGARTEPTAPASSHQFD